MLLRNTLKYVEILQKTICGLEIKISRTESKFKFDQKKKRHDIEGVIKGLLLYNKPEVSTLVAQSNPIV